MNDPIEAHPVDEQTEQTAIALRSPTSDLSLSRAPEVVLEEARKAALALAQVIESKAKKVKFNGETYLEFEDWQTLGRFYGISAGKEQENAEFIEFGDTWGFRASAVALYKGEIISRAVAYCMSDEPNWRTKPKFQLASMAQTRACAKALRNVLSWVVVLAGYRPTPAEEMTAPPPDIPPPKKGVNFGKVSTKPPKPPAPSESPAERKARFLALFTGMERAATLVFMDHEFLIPEVDEDFSDIDDSHIPRTKKLVDLLVAEVKARHAELSGAEEPEEVESNTESGPIPDSEPSASDPDLPKQPDLNECDQVRGKIMTVTVKEGESDRGAWKRFGIKIDEEWYSTFDHKIGHFAQTLKGRLVTAYFFKGERGNDLLWLK